LFWNLLKEFALHEFNVGYGDGLSRFFRCKHVAVACGNGDRDWLYFGLGEQGMPFFCARESSAQHGVGILRVSTRCEGVIRKDGRDEDGCDVIGCIHDEGLAIDFFRLERKRNGHEDGGDAGSSSPRGVASKDRVGRLFDVDLECGHGALSRRCIDRQES
jgi:hypothetical protein